MKKTNNAVDSRLSDTRQRTMLIALPLLAMLCAGSVGVIMLQPNSGTPEVALMASAGLLFAIMFVVLLKAPAIATRIIVYAIGLAFVVIWMRVYLMCVGPLYANESRSLFTGLYAYIPMFYIGMFLLMRPAAALIGALTAWAAIAGTVFWFTWPLWETNPAREGLSHLWLYLLLGQPTFIIMLSILPGYEAVVSNLNTRLDEAARGRDRMRYAAMHDHLTGLFNRQTFEQRLEKIWQDRRVTQRPCGLIVIDVDNFKQINDTRGHQAGDECLKWIADVISDSLRAGDIAARYGGDEFAVLLPGLNQSGTTAVAERIRERVSSQPPDALLPTVSLGTTSFVPHESRTPQTVFSQADQALYVAKSKGRNRVATPMDITPESSTNVSPISNARSAGSELNREK